MSSSFSVKNFYAPFWHKTPFQDPVPHVYLVYPQDTVMETGQFEVDSIHSTFEGAYYRWQHASSRFVICRYQLDKSSAYRDTFKGKQVGDEWTLFHVQWSVVLDRSGSGKEIWDMVRIPNESEDDWHKRYKKSMEIFFPAPYNLVSQIKKWLRWE